MTPFEWLDMPRPDQTLVNLIAIAVRAYEFTKSPYELDDLTTSDRKLIQWLRRPPGRYALWLKLLEG